MKPKTLNLYKQAIAASFSKVANSYDNFAFIEQEIGNRLLQRLEYINIKPQYILDLGCGSGYLSNRLQQLFPNATIIGLDLSFEMVKFASLNSKLKYCCADAESLPFSDQKFDLIFSSCCIPFIKDLESLYTELQRVLTIDGLLLFTTFGPDTLKELSLELNHTDMHHIGDLLLHKQYKNPVVDTEKIIFTYKKLHTLLHDLQGSGSFEIDFNSSENTHLPCQATFEVIYGHAQKQAVKPKQFTDTCGNTYIPITELQIL
jgi:malonyl-CoA O-methyltransferase